MPVRLTFKPSYGESTGIAALLGEDTLWASLRRVLRVRGLVVAATVAPALHPDATATRRMLARVAESVVGMPTPVRQPQPIVDISTVELDLAT